jgi:hypothetical protein
LKDGGTTGATGALTVVKRSTTGVGATVGVGCTFGLGDGGVDVGLRLTV